MHTKFLKRTKLAEILRYKYYIESIQAFHRINLKLKYIENGYNKLSGTSQKYLMMMILLFGVIHYLCNMLLID